MQHSFFRRFLSGIWEVAEVVVISLATVLVIRHFLFQPFVVSGASMEPNFSNGDYLVIDEATYRFREPHRGESVVFHYPRDPKTYFIKRIIGLPGERVLINGGNIKIVTSEGREIPLVESYLPSSMKTAGVFDVKLGPEEYFLLGDNRGSSYDSRNIGAINSDFLVGKVALRIYPFNDFGLVRKVTY